MECGKTSIPRVSQKYNTDAFENSECPDGINSLFFSQLCIYNYADVVPAVVNEIQEEDGQVYTQEITTNKEGKIRQNSLKTKHRNFRIGEDKLVGTVSNDHQPICVCGNDAINNPRQGIKASYH